MNPLLHFSGLPHFDQIKPEHVTPAITQLLEESRALVTRMESDTVTPTWDNFVKPLEDAEEKLSRSWSQVSHTNSVVNTPELREKLQSLGAEANGSTTAELVTAMRADYERYGTIVRRINLVLE